MSLFDLQSLVLAEEVSFIGSSGGGTSENGQCSCQSIYLCRP